MHNVMRIRLKSQKYDLLDHLPTSFIIFMITERRYYEQKGFFVDRKNLQKLKNEFQA